MCCTCDDCSATKTEAVDNLGHDWSDWKDDGANATTDTHSHTCNRNCGVAAESEPHSWGNWTPDGDTNHKKTCSVCGGTRTATHSWNEGIITTQPTEEEEGVKTYTCSGCGHTKTEPVDKLEHVHSWSDWGQNDENTHIRSCRCNETQTERSCPCNANETKDCTYDGGVVTEQPTHTEKGIKTYTCTVCGHTYTEDIPVLTDHAWGEWMINKLDEANTHIRYCVCDESQTAPHNFDDGKVTTEATHTTKGVKTFTCTDGCGYSYTEEIPETTEHQWSDWSDNKDGTHTRSCPCNANETEAHTWSSWADQNDGSYQRECADCGAFETMTLPENKPVNTTTNDTAANTNLTNTDIELIENVLTDEEQSQVADGAEVKVYLKVEDISNDAHAEHKAEAEDKAGNNEIGMYLDISLFKQIGTAAETPVTETNSKVTITITIPENLINTDASITRTYKIIRVHEDKNGQLITDVIEGVFNPDDNSFTFETDKFSTYALAYADKTVPNDSDSPVTGDNGMIILWIVLLCISSLGVITTVAYRRKRVL